MRGLGRFDDPCEPREGSPQYAHPLGNHGQEGASNPMGANNGDNQLVLGVTTLELTFTHAPEAAAAAAARARVAPRVAPPPRASQDVTRRLLRKRAKRTKKRRDRDPQHPVPGSQTPGKKLLDLLVVVRAHARLELVISRNGAHTNNTFVFGRLPQGSSDASLVIMHEGKQLPPASSPSASQA